VSEIEIKGGASEFEAAVVAVVIDQIERDTARQGRLDRGPGLPAWVRAIRSDDPAAPREIVWPE